MKFRLPLSYFAVFHNKPLLFNLRDCYPNWSTNFVSPRLLAFKYYTWDLMICLMSLGYINWMWNRSGNFYVCRTKLFHRSSWWFFVFEENLKGESIHSVRPSGYFHVPSVVILYFQREVQVILQDTWQPYLAACLCKKYSKPKFAGSQVAFESNFYSVFSSSVLIRSHAHFKLFN